MEDTLLAARVGAKVREIRQSRKLTLKQVSELSGVKLPTLGRIELGERELSVAGLLRLADALDVSVLVLLGRDSPESKDAASTIVDCLPHDAGALRQRLLAALRALGSPDGPPTNA